MNSWNSKLSGMWGIDEEYLHRQALIETVISAAHDAGGSLTREQLGRISFMGHTVRVINPQGGIWRPAIGKWPFGDLRAAISVNTTLKGPYEDQEFSDGVWRYDYQSGGVDLAANRAVRAALELELPLLWFRKQVAGGYVPHRVFIVGDRPDSHFFLLSPDRALAVLASSDSPLERRYAIREIRQRVHQPEFRSRVIAAYETRCAICSLRHAELLDAAHITPDSAEHGTAAVSNGLSLCKIHHSAYDADIMGIAPNLKVHVRIDILDEVDGPMLQHGIKEMHGRTITVPRRQSDQPDPERLAERFARFAS